MEIGTSCSFSLRAYAWPYYRRVGIFREVQITRILQFAKVYSRIEITGILPLLLLNNEHSEARDDR